MSTPLTRKEKVLKEDSARQSNCSAKRKAGSCSLLPTIAAYGSKGTRSNPAPLYALNYLERPHRQHTKKWLPRSHRFFPRSFPLSQTGSMCNMRKSITGAGMGAIFKSKQERRAIYVSYGSSAGCHLQQMDRLIENQKQIERRLASLERVCAQFSYSVHSLFN